MLRTQGKKCSFLKDVHQARKTTHCHPATIPMPPLTCNFVLAVVSSFSDSVSDSDSVSFDIVGSAGLYGLEAAGPGSDERGRGARVPWRHGGVRRRPVIAGGEFLFVVFVASYSWAE